MYQKDKINKKINRLIEGKVIDRENKSIGREMKEKEINELKTGEGEEPSINLSEAGITRRSFLKKLGLGVGGLALTSQFTGAWSLIQPSKEGVSDIDADTVDGTDREDIQDPYGWEKVGTLNFSSQNSLTHNISTSYDLYRLEFSGVTTDADEALSVRVNGLSGGYEFESNDASTVTDWDKWRLVYELRASQEAFGTMTIAGNWTNVVNFSSQMGGQPGVEIATHGLNNNASSPLSSIEVFAAYGGNLTGDVEIFGRNNG
ncbi:MAG: hypothetical protein ACI8Z7_000662 [Candidatus Nanohaloarchaea archaeon]|jgi:hypothetical protein